jgi:hypothetical protein
MAALRQISVVVRVNNSEATLQEFVDPIAALLERAELAYEVIIVNDGRADGSTFASGRDVVEFCAYRPGPMKRHALDSSAACEAVEPLSP